MVQNIRKKELYFSGLATSSGIAIGKAVILSRETFEIIKKTISKNKTEQEIKRFYEALNTTREELSDIKKRVLHKIGEQDAKIFDAHLLILDDKIVIDQTIKRIKEEHCNVEWAYFEIMRAFYDSLIDSEDDYLKERSVDILDVKGRVIRNLLGNKASLVLPSLGFRIVVAHQLTPSQTVLLDRNVVLGFAVDLGGRTSHVAILSKGLEKPSVVGLKNFAKYVEDGDKLIVDGNNGIVILSPLKETLLKYRNLQEKFQHFLHDLKPIKDLPAKTLDGHLLQLEANIEFPAEVESVKLHSSEGVGLFRTEYLYLSKRDFPSENEQYQEYKEVVDNIYPNSVVIRTFDLGGDRLMIGDLKIEEQNPFLGWRSIRISLDLPDLFLTQLRAILRSSSRQNVKIMFPMISSVDEIEKSKDFLKQAMQQFDEEKIDFDPRIEVGIMVEVPATVLIADHLAKMVDFFSIGTNDLIQYTLAVDRGNERIASLYTNYHPSVLKLIKETVEIAHKNDIWVGLCGEMAGDPLIVPFLVGVGLDELSMTPAVIPEVKKMIRSIRYNSAKRLTEEILEFSRAEEIKNELMKYFKKELPKLEEFFFPAGNLNKNTSGDQK